MSLLAGESAGLTRQMMSAGAIVDEMMRDAAAVINNRLNAMVNGAAPRR
jgi:hypothetical protein